MSNIGIRLGHRALQESSCSSCVERSDCVFCLYTYATSFDSGTCLCGSTFEFNYDSFTYEYKQANCGLYEDEFNSKVDCKFDAENGEIIAAVIGTFVLIAIVLIGCCIAKSGACSEESSMSAPPPSKSRPPRTAAYEPEETAPRPVAEAIPDRPESLRVCSIMATDVVLMDTATVEEPITVLPAESEIIVAPRFDV